MQMRTVLKAADSPKFITEELRRSTAQFASSSHTAPARATGRAVDRALRPASLHPQASPSVVPGSFAPPRPYVILPSLILSMLSLSSRNCICTASRLLAGVFISDLLFALKNTAPEDIGTRGGRLLPALTSRPREASGGLVLSVLERSSALSEDIDGLVVCAAFRIST